MEGGGAGPASAGFGFRLAGAGLGEVARGRDPAWGRGVRSMVVGLVWDRVSRLAVHAAPPRRSADAVGRSRELPGTAAVADDDVFVGDDVQGQAAVALAADEVALEERTARDVAAGVGDPAEQGDAPLDRGEAGVAAAGGDLGGQVDQLGVFPPRPDGDHHVAAGAQVAGGEGEDAGEPGEQPVMADVGQVPAVKQVAVEVVAFVDAARAGVDLAVGGRPVRRRGDDQRHLSEQLRRAAASPGAGRHR